MLSLLFALRLAVNIGPAYPDSPPRERQMAADGSAVALTIYAGNAIYFSRSQDSGTVFSLPIKVAEAEIVALTCRRGPRTAFSGSAIVISAVMGRKPGEGPDAHALPAYKDLIVWRSTDGGTSGFNGTMINDVAGAPAEFFVPRHRTRAASCSRPSAAWEEDAGINIKAGPRK